MSDLIKTLVTKQDIEALVSVIKNDIREDNNSLVETIRENQKIIFRWMLFFAVTQTVITSAMLLYFLK